MLEPIQLIRLVDAYPESFLHPLVPDTQWVCPTQHLRVD